MLERDTVIEIVVSVSAVGVMLATMYWIGITYDNGDTGGLSPEGGELLVGAIIGFIFLLTVAGVGLAFALNDPEDDLETGGNETDADGRAF